MTHLAIVKDLPAALAQSDTLLVVGQGAQLTVKRAAKLFDRACAAAIHSMAAEARAGSGGSVQSSCILRSTKPVRVVLGLIPEQSSRHNCPARPDAIQRVVGGAGLRGTATAVVFLLDPAHQIPALAAIARAFPIFHRRTSKESDTTTVHLLLVGPDDEPLAVDRNAEETMRMVREVSAIVDTPPSERDPARLAQAVRHLLRGVPSVTLKVLQEAALQKAKLGGLLAVGRAAEVPPRLLLATYEPRRPQGPHVALVGKGITFDTGGLHLKARGSMEGMKSDMAGAAALAGAFRVLIKSGIRSKVSLVLCLAENAVGPRAYKPDDILTLHSGKTVEINNTDAEGRLVLADGVSYAARVLKAKIIVDAATLTGAQAIATGTLHAAVIASDAALEQNAVHSGLVTGDLVHPLPFAPELFQAEFKSPLADMRNSVKNRANAPTSCAAQFIFSHLDGEDVRWCHIDLAGPAFRADRATGFGVALVYDLVRTLIANASSPDAVSPPGLPARTGDRRRSSEKKAQKPQKAEKAEKPRGRTPSGRG